MSPMDYLKKTGKYNEKLMTTDWVAAYNDGQETPLCTNNGKAWCRKDKPGLQIDFRWVFPDSEIIEGRDQEDFAQEYAKQLEINKKYCIQYRINGINEEAKHTRISQKIKDKVSLVECAHCGSKNRLEYDHKFGVKLSINVRDSHDEKDFQALCKNCNDKKRQACIMCRETGDRFNAIKFGYTISHIGGSHIYDDTISCNGCYWHDPLAFKSKLTVIQEN